MTLVIFNLVFFAISVVLFLHAPGDYNLAFCSTVLTVFTVQNVLYFLFDQKKSLLSFEFFFAVSFLFVDFIYPVFFYPTTPKFALFTYSWKYAVMSRATALAYLAYTSYMLGVTRFTKFNNPSPPEVTFRFGMNHFLILFAVMILSFAGFILTGGWGALQNVYTNRGDLGEVGIYSYFRNIFTITAYLIAMFIFRLKRKQMAFYIAAVSCCMLVIIATGSRSLAIGLVLILLICFNNYVRRFRAWEVLAVTAMGALALFLIMATRGDGYKDAVGYMSSGPTVNRIFLVFTDLLVNNRNLYVLVDYADKHELTWLHGMLVDLCSFIPGMTRRLVEWTGQPMELLSGGHLPTYLRFGREAAFGLGTSMVGEAYRSFGTVGMCVIFFLTGHLVKTTYRYSGRSIYAYTLFYLLASHSLTWPRSPIIFDPRTVVWSLALVFLINGFVKFPELYEQLQQKLKQRAEEQKAKGA